MNYFTTATATVTATTATKCFTLLHLMTFYIKKYLNVIYLLLFVLYLRQQ